MIRNFTLAFLIFFASEKVFALHPEAHYISTPSLSGLLSDSLNIQTTDHARLTGWYCKPAQDTSQFIVVMAGGDAGNMSYDIPLAQFFMDNFHVPVLLFDYRGFGTSDAFKSDSNAIGYPQYLTDIDAAVSFAALRYPNRKIIVYGRSLGASLALVEGSKRDGITGVIAECPYASQASLAQHIKNLNPKVTITPIASKSLEPAPAMAVFRPNNLLVLHGQSERAILSGEVEALVNAAPASNKKFIDFENCDHLEIPFQATQQFGEAIHDFLVACE